MTFMFTTKETHRERRRGSTPLADTYDSAPGYSRNQVKGAGTASEGGGIAVCSKKTGWRAEATIKVIATNRMVEPNPSVRNHRQRSGR